MDKRAVNVCLVILLGMILYAIVSEQYYDRSSYNRKDDKTAVVWDDCMEKTEDNGVYFFRTLLPSEDITGKVIVYNTVHMNLQVRIGGELVYALETKGDGTIKTTGYEWNCITFQESDAGKEIEFQVTPAYADSRPREQFYYGVRSEVERRIIGERLSRFVVSAVIFLCGILLKMYEWLIVRKAQEGEDNSLHFFSVFTIMLGIWSLCETQLFELFLPGSILLVFLDHMMLMCMPVPFLLFIRQMYQNKNHPLWWICCYLDIGVVCVRVALQLFGVLDLRETLWMTHLCLCIFIVVVIGLSIHEVMINRFSGQFKINIVCVLIIMVATLSELFLYRISNRSTPLGSLGFLVYIVVMGTMSIRNSRRMMERAKESEIYRRLAFIDELTGVYNRTAFNRDKESRMLIDQKTQQGKILPTVVFMFDLNDLKKCNDTYGHEYGDQYITMISEVLKNIFGLDGNCYRIGGDEFCVMMPYGSENEIKNKLLQFQNAVREKNRKGFVVPVSVAAGYGIYDASMDNTLDDTMHRADEMMYQEKQRMKAAR